MKCFFCNINFDDHNERLYCDNCKTELMAHLPSRFFSELTCEQMEKIIRLIDEIGGIFKSDVDASCRNITNNMESLNRNISQHVLHQFKLMADDLTDFRNRSCEMRDLIKKYINKEE